MVEAIDASKTAADVNPSTLSLMLILFGFYSSSDLSPCQISLEETPMQEQLSDSLFIRNDPAVADIQTVDPLFQHTTDGKNVICLVYFSTTNTN